MNKETVMAFTRLVCTLVASAAAMAGFAIDADAIFTGAMCAIALAAFIWSWWKNNNITQAAQDAQELLDIAKACSDRRGESDEFEEEDPDEDEEEVEE